MTLIGYQLRRDMGTRECEQGLNSNAFQISTMQFVQIL